MMIGSHPKGPKTADHWCNRQRFGTKSQQLQVPWKRERHAFSHEPNQSHWKQEETGQIIQKIHQRSRFWMIMSNMSPWYYFFKNSRTSGNQSRKSPTPSTCCFQNWCLRKAPKLCCSLLTTAAMSSLESGKLIQCPFPEAHRRIGPGNWQDIIYLSKKMNHL